MLAALSGGSDSSALLLLLSDHLKTHAPHVRMLAVTVDHGLRAESAAEAQGAGAFAEKLGVPQRILRWEGAKPRTGVPAAARAARYRLLADAAGEAGARIVFTGHTADDQAETVAMRLARGEGRGLAGMAPLTLFESRVWIARPLLDARREALQDFLRERGFGWADDPTNTDERFERARLRQKLAGLEYSRGSVLEGVASSKHAEGAPPNENSVEELLHLARQAGKTRRQIAEQAASLLQAHADQPVPGLFRLSPTFLDDASRPAAIEALRFLLAAIGGKRFPVDVLRTGTLLDALAKPGRHTLGGVVAERRSDAVFLHREHRGIAVAGSGAVYDGRFRLSAFPRPGSVGPWGDRFDAKELASVPGAPKAILRAAFAAAPAFYPQGGGLPAPLDAVGIACTPVVAPFRDFLPGFDLRLAQALAKLFKALVFPSAPHRSDWKELA